MLVYGWKLIDYEVPERGRAKMLLAPTSQTSSTQIISELRVLEGDVDSLFELSGTIASADRITARDMLSQLYSVFHRLFIQLSGMAPLSPGAAGRLAQHMSAPLAMKICELIRQGMEDIKGNASMSIAAETMLISIREAYNAENSRN